VTDSPRSSKGTHGDSCECYSCWHKRKSAKRVCLECDGDGVIGRTLERCESCAGSGLSLAGPVRIHQCEFLGCALPKGHSGVHAESNALTHEQILAMDQRAQAVLLGATYFDDPRPSDLTPEQEIDRLVAARTGPGRPMVQRPNEAPTRPSCASCAGPAPGKYCTSCVMSGRASAHDRQELTDEIERLRVVIKTGGAMYRAERLALECGMGGMPPDEPRTQDTQYSEGDWIDLRCRCCKSHPLMRGWKFCPDCGNGIRAELRENAKPYTTPRSDNPQRDAKMPVLVDIVVARRFVREINSYETPEAAAKALAAEFAEVRRIALSYAPRVDYPTVTELLDVLRRIAKYSTDPIVAADAATAVRQVESRSDSVTTPKETNRG